MKTRGLELNPHLRKRPTRIVCDRQFTAIDQPVDVVHAETDAFHMKGTNREAEGGALLEKGIASGALRLRLDTRDQGLQVVVGRLAVVRVGGHGICETLC